jgi:anti-sigma B factor antagonist
MDISFDISARRSRGVSTISARGELDVASADRLERVLRLTLDESFAQDVVLDLTDLTFCDSAGVRVLVNANRLAELNDARLTIAVSEGEVMDCLEVSGMADVLPVVSVRIDSPGRINGLQVRAARQGPPIENPA